MRIALGGDSAGEPLVRILTAHLKQGGEHQVDDLSKPEPGTNELYAHLTDRVAHRILDGDYDRGILCCGTGIGVSISANKIPGMRAALSNNAQIITMGARVIGPDLAKSIVDAFLAQSFDPRGRSASNVAAIDALDAKYGKTAAG